jgi:2-polyprenyl-3-methyl-5-hydroxy-6-metoxy-1,4-benzoquinol methylase
MSIYHIPAVDPTVVNSSQAIELELVGHGRTVLDVGCATGYLARALAEQDCIVTGVEYDPEAAEEARPSLKEVVVADLETVDLVAQFDGQTFDAIVFGDVLEHLTDADGVLKSATQLLAPDGAIVISVPNVSHGSLRLALLQGRWDYRDTGLLDRDHVRFFTRESLFAMLRGAGLVVTDLRATVFDPLASEVEIDDEALPPAVVDWVRSQPDATVYQFVLRAVRGEWDDESVPELVPAVALAPVDDVHTARAGVERELHASADGRQRIVDEVLELRHRVLTLRDNAVGIEASLGTARIEVERARAAEQHAYDECERLIEELKHTSSWRLGTTLVSPLARIKRAIRG